jgi:hypothetical protein
MLLFHFAAALRMVRRGTQSLSMARFAPNVALQRNRSLGKYVPLRFLVGSIREVRTVKSLPIPVPRLRLLGPSGFQLERRLKRCCVVIPSFA